jgi:hypothetical protein
MHCKGIAFFGLPNNRYFPFEVQAAELLKVILATARELAFSGADIRVSRL